MSEPTSPSEIEQKLAATRAEMTATVDALVDQLDPRKQAKAAAEQAKVKANEAVDQARLVVADAKAGDQSAMLKVAGVVGGVALVGGLILRRIVKR